MSDRIECFICYSKEEPLVYAFDGSSSWYYHRACDDSGRSKFEDTLAELNRIEQEWTLNSYKMVV